METLTKALDDQAGLIAETSAYGDALAPLGTTARKHGLTALGFHATAKAVSLRPFSAVRLKCPLGHVKALLRENICPWANIKYNGWP